MMGDIVLFKPRSRVKAQQNLAAFVALCRNELTVFGHDLPFDEMTWEVTDYIPLKGKKSSLRAVFSSWVSANDRSPVPMAEPFLSFAKSYFRYQHGFRPTKVIGFRIAATRALSAALDEQGTSDPSSTNSRALNRAAQLIKAKFSDSAGYRVAQQLKMLADFMDLNRLVTLPLQWSNPLPRSRELGGRVGEEFEAARQKKLPSPFALDALARAFRAATNLSDQVVTGVAAILCSAPDRVNEVLILRTDCAVTIERPNQAAAYGLRFWPAKGAEPMLKWVVPSMASVVKEALTRLNATSSEARLVATWYELNPKSMFLPPHLEHLRGQDLTMGQLRDVLFVESRGNSVSRQWCKGNNVPFQKRGRELVVKFVDVEAVVIGALPRFFPLLDVETGVRFSQALCVVRRNELHAERATFRCIIEAVDQNFISTGLGNRSEHGFNSVFDNLGFFETDGSSIRIRTQQFRHYLNTLAHAGGLSELDIAKWSGRKDIQQNSVYNHVSDRDTQAQISALRQEAQGDTSKSLIPQRRINLISRQRFSELGVHAAHTTEFGICVHDFSMTPCALHLDCINCNEQVCIKGDELGEFNARAMRTETETLLAEAEAAESNGQYGANRWVEHQRTAHSRLNELITILENPLVPTGAVIRLTHIKPASRFQLALDARKSIEANQSTKPMLMWSVVDEMKNEKS